jgi:lysophospholipase
MIPAASIFEPFSLTAPGAVLRAARFPGNPDVPAQGVCVLLNGQTEFIEKYFETIDELRGRGFAVATMDWRGQGGSSRLLTDDSRKSYVADFRDYDLDLAALMHTLVEPMLAPGTQPIALAHSMGGHNLLRYLTQHPDSFAACALSAPMIGISLRGQREWMVRLVTWWEIRRGNRGGWVWGMQERDPHAMTFATQMVTSDAQRFERTQMLLREYPNLRMAGATWGWLAAALRSMAWLRARAERIATPLLIVGAGKDRICLTAEAKAFAARAPHADWLEIADAEHELLAERSVYRDQFWAAFDAFIKKPRSVKPGAQRA